MVDNPEDTLELYNEEQLFYVRVEENCTTVIQQMKDSIKLQEDIKIMSNSKIKELATK